MDELQYVNIAAISCTITFASHVVNSNAQSAVAASAAALVVAFNPLTRKPEYFCQAAKAHSQHIYHQPWKRQFHK